MKYYFKKTTLFALILAAVTLLPGNELLTHAGEQTLTIKQQKINPPPDNGSDMREFLPGENLILQDPKTAGLSSSESIVLNQLREIIRFVSQSQVPSGGEQSKINLEFEPLKAGAAELIFKSGSRSKRLNIEVLPGLNYFMLPKVDLVNAGDVETIQIGLSGTFNVVMPHPQFNLVEVSEKVSSDELSEGELKLLKENTEKVMPFVGVNPNPQETGLFDLLFTGLDQPGVVKFLFEVIPACRWEPKPCAQSITTKTLNVESVSGIEPSGVQRVDLRNLEGKDVSLQKAAGGDFQMIIPRPEYRFVRVEQEIKGELTEDYGTQIAWDILSKEAGLSERDKSNIRIQAFEKARWLEDRCMGWDIPGESCTGEGVPKGFLLVIELYGNIYKFHGDIHRPALTRLDPAKISALIAMKDVSSKGDGFSKIKLGKIMSRYENQVLLFDIELVAKKKQWKYTVDFKQKAILSYSVRLSDGRVPVYDPAGNLIREDRPDGSYLELNWDPLYRIAILHDPQGNTFAYQGLNYTDSRKGILNEYTLLTTDPLAVPPRFISGRFFETVVNGVRSLHLHRHGVDILFDPKNPQVVANIIMGREDILSLLKTAEENLNLEDSKRIERIEARIQIILNKVIQQIREPEPPFPPDSISLSQIQDFQSFIIQQFKKWREIFSKVPTLSDPAVIILTDTFAQFQAGVEHFDPAKHKIRVFYLSDDLDAQGMIQQEVPSSETWKSVDLEPPNIMENKLNGFLTGLEAMTSYRMKIEILDRENEGVLSETPAISFITTHLNREEAVEVKAQAEQIIASLRSQNQMLKQRVNEIFKIISGRDEISSEASGLYQQVTAMHENIKSLIGNDSDTLSRSIAGRADRIMTGVKEITGISAAKVEDALQDVLNRNEEALAEVESIGQELQDPTAGDTETVKDLLTSLKALEGRFIALTTQTEDLEKQIKTGQQKRVLSFESLQSVLPQMEELLGEARGISKVGFLAKIGPARKLGIPPEEITIVRMEKREWGYTVDLDYKKARLVYQVDKAGNVAFDIWTSTEHLLELAQTDLVRRLGREAMGIEVKTVELMFWPDTCLDLSSDSVCRDVKTPGYRIIFSVKGTKTYEYHTDLYDRVGLVSERMPGVEEKLAMEYLVDALEIPDEDRLEMGAVIFEQAHWPNGCLGFDLPRQGCAAIAFADGYRLVMAVYGNLFEIHGIASSPGDFRLDPAQDSAIIAIRNLRDRGIRLSTIKIESSVLRYENDTVYFDVDLSSEGHRYSFTVDYWKKEIKERGPE